ncbi:hypothetical protein CSA37_02705 [Candidatus Fermentibacteria bacterium]|nr:MAG: hypothetical protein CSA37_02705 [Candidatus Fermentibacteria bacterium]
MQLLLKALEAGNRVCFISMSSLIRKHSDYLRRDMPARMLTNLTKPSVLVLDEIGYTPLDNKAATLLFDVIDIRYRKRKPGISGVSLTCFSFFFERTPAGRRNQAES